MLIKMPTIVELALAVTAQTLSRGSDDNGTVSKIACASNELRAFIQRLTFVNALIKQPDFEAPYADIERLKRYIKKPYYTELLEKIYNAPDNYYVWGMARLALVMYELKTSTMLEGTEPADMARDFLYALFPLFPDEEDDDGYWDEADGIIFRFLEMSELTQSIEQWEWDAMEWVFKPNAFGERCKRLVEEQARALGLRVGVKRKRQMRITLDSL
jgi:hypothetical protein